MLQLDSYRSKRPAADFVSRNRRAAKTVKRKTTLPMDAKREQVTPRPPAAKVPGSHRKAAQPASRRIEDPEPEGRKLGGNNDTVVISKDYLDSLLKMTVMKNLERGERETIDTEHGQQKRPRDDSGRDRSDHGSGKGKSDRRSGHRNVVVSPSSVPGLQHNSNKALSSGHHSQQQASHSPAGEPSPRRNRHVKASSPVEEYFPFGRPGCGAPLRTASGQIMADLRSLVVQTSQQHYSLPPSLSSTAHQRYSSPPHGAQTSGPERRQAARTVPSDKTYGTGEESCSPRFARGVGPHVDQYMLRERAEKRKRELEHKMFLKEQMEAKQRAKREAREKIEREEREEEARLAREMHKYQEEYRRDMERATRKEEESRRRQFMLQEAIEKAAQDAAHAKQTSSKTSSVPARKHGTHRQLQDTPSHHTVTFDLSNAYMDSDIDTMPSKYQLRSSSLLHLSGEDTPPPGHAHGNKQQQRQRHQQQQQQQQQRQQYGHGDSKRRGSKIPVASRHLANKDNPSKEKATNLRKGERIRRRPEPPASPPVPTVVKKLNWNRGGMGSSNVSMGAVQSSLKSNSKREEVPAVRTCSPPVPALARKMRQHQTTASNEGILQTTTMQQDNPLNTTYVRGEASGGLHQTSLPSVRVTTSPPVPTLRNTERLLPAIPQSSSTRCFGDVSVGKEKVVHLPPVVSTPAAVQVASINQPFQTNRQQAILQQLAQLRTGLLSHCSEIDFKLDSLLNRTAYTL